MPAYRFAVLGDPVEHSRSPQIHRAMLELAGLEGTYEAIRADPDVLSSTVSGLRTGEWQGLNVTMPLKRAAADLSDRLTRDAERSRSVNTLLLRTGDVWGHSTDAATFRHIFSDPRFVGIGSILLLGAGGSAAAALIALEGDRPLYVSARRSVRSDEITSALGGETVPWGTAVAGALVINTTPLGMSGENLPGDVLVAASGLVDLPYSANPTPAVAAARERNLPVADGHEFLVRQALASFHLWTGVAIDYSELIATLTKA